jgi:hypothetical protein
MQRASSTRTITEWARLEWRFDEGMSLIMRLIALREGITAKTWRIRGGILRLQAAPLDLFPLTRSWALVAT